MVVNVKYVKIWPRGNPVDYAQHLPFDLPCTLTSGSCFFFPSLPQSTVDPQWMCLCWQDVHHVCSPWLVCEQNSTLMTSRVIMTSVLLPASYYLAPWVSWWLDITICSELRRRVDRMSALLKVLLFLRGREHKCFTLLLPMLGLSQVKVAVYSVNRFIV